MTVDVKGMVSEMKTTSRPIVIDRCCDLKPRPMLGMSWWKNLGFNSPCKCCEQLADGGYRYISDYVCKTCAEIESYGLGSCCNDWRCDPEWIKLWVGDDQ
jgi:hypothetical protein